MADTPAVCTRSAIHDYTWQFHISQNIETVNLYNVQEVCTHKMPNRKQVVGKDYSWNFQKEDIYLVEMNKDFQVAARFCKDGDVTKCGEEKIGGTWKILERSQLVVDLSNGLGFVASMRYDLNPALGGDLDPKTLEERMKKLKKKDNKGAWVSDCSQTMVGFAQDNNIESTIDKHVVTCFYAKRASEAKSDSLAQLEIEEEAPRAVKRGNMFAEHKASKKVDNQIQWINESNLGWKANTCMLSGDHPAYECDYQPGQEEFIMQEDDPNVAVSNTKNEDIKKVFKKNKVSGEKLPKNQTSQFLAAVEKAKTFQKYSEAALMPDDVVPESWDWRNVAGYDFTDELRDQGHCGSCYTISFIQSINARLKIKYGEKGAKVPKVSAQQILSCNYMQEGCEGGQGFFNGVWAQRASFVEESCAPYKPAALDLKNQCHQHKHCPSVARVQKSYYLGGDKFKADELDIRKELLMHGPVVTSFNVDDDYSFKQSGKFDEEEDVSWSVYKSGILKQDQRPADYMKSFAQHGASKSQDGLVVPASGAINFAQTSSSSAAGHASQALGHSVIIIGFSVDKETSTPIWICRNSYGDHWGMRGDFYVRRGLDDFGIESEVQGHVVEML